MQDAQSSRLASSTVTTCVVTAFLAFASVGGLMGGTESPAFGAGWSLRGTLVPAAEASAAQVGDGSITRSAHPPLQGRKNPV